MLRRNEGGTVALDPIDLHRQAVVVDAHCDTILHVARGRRRLGVPSDEGHLDLPRLLKGGVDVQFFALYIEPEYKPDRGLKRVLEHLDTFYQELEDNHDALFLITDKGQLPRAGQQDRVGAVLAIEGGEAIGDSLAALRALYRLGVRSLGLTWNQRNLIADGVGESRSGGGLTNFGLKVVKECNRLGILIDVSHLSVRGFWDVLEASEQPVIASHSNARAMCDHPRNLDDDQIKALAAAGGVMGMNFAPAFLRADGKATLQDVIRHISYIAELVGPDHVGLGSDFDGIRNTPRGLEDVSRLPALTEALLEHGFSPAEVRKILGENFLRVMDQVWRS